MDSWETGVEEWHVEEATETRKPPPLASKKAVARQKRANVGKRGGYAAAPRREEGPISRPTPRQESPCQVFHDLSGRDQNLATCQTYSTGLETTGIDDRREHSTTRLWLQEGPEQIWPGQDSSRTIHPRSTTCPGRRRSANRSWTWPSSGRSRASAKHAL